MNDIQIELFLAITDAGSFSRAEQTQFISKQAMIKQMRNLEKELGVTLFERTRAGIKLTQEGTIFYEGAKHLLQQKNQLCMDILKHAGKNVLRIGNMPHQVLLDKAVEGFCRQYPQIEIQRIVHPNHSGEYRVEHDIQDVAESFLTDVSPENLPYTFLPLLEAPYYALMDSHHPFAAQTSLSLQQLSQYPVTYFKLMLQQAYIDQLHDVFTDPSNLQESMDVDHQIEQVFSIQNTQRIVIGANPALTSLHGIQCIPLSENWTRTYGIICAKEEPSIAAKMFIEYTLKEHKKIR